MICYNQCSALIPEWDASRPEWAEATEPKFHRFQTMTSIQARALVKAREDFARARRELEAQRLRETRYRGVAYTVDNRAPSDVNRVLTYRGIRYSK